MAANKLVELILHVSQKCQTQDYFGKTKLNKILYYADFVAFAKYGKSITGVDYFKIEKGPAPRSMKPTLVEMEARKDLVFVPRVIFDKVEQRPTALRLPDLSVFTPDEIDVVNDIIRCFSAKTGKALSLLSHLEAGYKSVDMGETIPYSSVFWNLDQGGPITPRESAAAKKVAARYRLAIQ